MVAYLYYDQLVGALWVAVGSDFERTRSLLQPDLTAEIVHFAFFALIQLCATSASSDDECSGDELCLFPTSPPHHEHSCFAIAGSADACVRTVPETETLHVGSAQRCGLKGPALRIKGNITFCEAVLK